MTSKGATRNFTQIGGPRSIDSQIDFQPPPRMRMPCQNGAAISRPNEVWTDLAYTAFLTKGMEHTTASNGQTPQGRDGTTHKK